MGQERFGVKLNRRIEDTPTLTLATAGGGGKDVVLEGDAVNFAIVLRYNDGVELRICRELAGKWCARKGAMGTIRKAGSW
jgi:hypothetical protein